MNTYDYEGQTYKQLGSDDELRLGFIRKVFGILSVQLLITTLICGMATGSTGLQEFLKSHPALMIFVFVISLGVVYALVCFKSVARQVPTNYVLLVVFTLCQSYMTASVCAFTLPRLVLAAAVMTLAITIGLTVYAMTTKMDFTKLNEGLFIAAIVLVFAGFILLFTDNKFLHVLFSAVVIFFYGMYLIYDVQLVAGGHKHELSYDDYIIGALMIYIDIMVIFTRLLRLLRS